MDLLYAKLDLAIIPQDLDILDINNLRGADEKSLMSLSGPRVADQVMRLVPNVDTFRLALRSIKLWAASMRLLLVVFMIISYCILDRGVYNNKVGYPGGVAWAVLVVSSSFIHFLNVKHSNLSRLELVNYGLMLLHLRFLTDFL